MNRREIERAVARGVRLLDEKDPQWWRNGTTPNGINIDKLDMASRNACILGQRGEGCYPYSERTSALGIECNAQYSHGFDLLSERTNESWSFLAECWIAVIESRRHPKRRNVPEWVRRANRVAGIGAR